MTQSSCPDPLLEAASVIFHLTPRRPRPPARARADDHQFILMLMRVL
jgi:hypothetical protein